MINGDKYSIATIEPAILIKREYMKYIVAVSGGVDSVVLLHYLVKEGRHDLVVAHFDHGIRTDSTDDARFVEGLAALYSLPFVVEHATLGSEASEERARIKRYAFLRAAAKKYNATVVTAHHANDVIETIAINLQRGTGWRGLAAVNGAYIERPLLNLTKEQIRAYALRHRLEWVEDSTNASDRYLRNRLRRTISKHLNEEAKSAVFSLWKQQVRLADEIDMLTALSVRSDNLYERYIWIMADTPSALELLRAVILAKSGTSPTRPQLERALLAIKVAPPGARHDVGGGIYMQFSQRTFIVQTP